jgi:predicted metal-dependent phosphoesterase TrpH
VIDLHCHSLFSDGTDAPETLAGLAEEAGLTALALTDHDTLDGLPRFLAAQSKVRTRLIPGLELSCQFMKMELHILGLFIDPWDSQLQHRIADLRQRREERNDGMIKRLRALNIPITLKEVAAMAPTRLLSRVHFAKALVNRGAAGSRQDAFARIIGDGCPGHVPFRVITPGEAVLWISEAGGVAILAHPGRSSNRSFRWEEAMLDLKQQGIVGFEAYYGEYGPTEQRYFCDLARKLDMVPCGGSDYHGTYKQGLSLGIGRGSLHVPDEVLGALEARLPRRGPVPNSETDQT